MKVFQGGAFLTLHYMDMQKKKALGTNKYKFPSKEYECELINSKRFHKLLCA